MEVLPAKPGPIPKTVSSRLKASLQHPTKTGFISQVQFSPNGQMLIAGDYPGGTIQTWDVATGKQLATLETGHGLRGSAQFFFVSPDWQTVYVTRGKTKVDRVEKDGKRLVDWKNEGDLRAWNLASGKLLHTWNPDPPVAIMNAQFSPDGGKLATFEYPAGVFESRPPGRNTLWDLPSGQQHNLPGELSYVTSFSPDSKTLVAYVADKDNYTTAIKFLDAADGKDRLTIPIREPFTSAYVQGFSPDSRIAFGPIQTYPAKRDTRRGRPRSSSGTPRPAANSIA